MSLMADRELSLSVQSSPLLSFWDGSSRARIEAHRPTDRPDLWQRYVEGLVDSYRQYGTESALDFAAFAGGETTSFFFVALNIHEEVVGGTRIHGPLTEVDQARALVELSADPRGVATARQLIADWLPFRVIEMKGGWVHRAANHRRELADTISRCFLHSMRGLDAQFAIGTGSTHVLRCWSSTGGRVVESIAPVPYPDSRYQTSMMWWHYPSIETTVAPDQLARFRDEVSAIERRRSRRALPLIPLPRSAS
jgi:hypothetical protein